MKHVLAPTLALVLLSAPPALAQQLAPYPSQPYPYPYYPQQPIQPQSPTTSTAPTSYTILGQHVANEDGDTDIRVSTTQTTSANPERRDILESRPEARREGEGRHVSVAPLFGFGTNDLGVGLGARAGYTFDTPVYLGGTFLYHFGTDNSVAGTGLTESHSRFMYPAAELGYDFGIGAVLIRPYVGGGILFGSTSSRTLAGVERSASERPGIVYPGVTGQYIFHRSPVFVGGDTRLLIPLVDRTPSFALLATGGLLL
jgi:hypothetical protein